jgi:hypothetical protein
MEVGYQKAVDAFLCFPKYQQIPSLHPYYIVVDSERDNTLKPVFFFFKDGNNIYYHGFHLGSIPNSSWKDIQSPYGYGGPISSTTDDLFLRQAWSAFSEWCKENRVIAEFIRFHPLLENWKYYFGLVQNERQTVWIDLTCSDLLSSYSTRATRSVKRALNNSVVFEWWENKEEFVNHFLGLYNELMFKKKADQLYFFSDQYFRKLVKWQNSLCAVCKHQNKIIVAGIFLISSSHAEYHLSAANDLGKEYRATSLLFHEVGLACQKSGIPQFHLGGGTDNNVNNSLLYFKSGFSKKGGEYKIGKHIYQNEIYENLKLKWEMKNKHKTERILFYR